MPCPETVLTGALANVHATVLHGGVYIFLGFAYQKFPMHGDCAAALRCLQRLLSEQDDQNVSPLQSLGPEQSAKFTID